MVMRFHSKSIEEHGEVPLPDAGRWESLVNHWNRHEGERKPEADSENACFVVSVRRRGALVHPEAQLAEIVGLVEAQGDRVVGTLTQELVRPDARTLLRKGVAEQVAEAAEAVNANLLVLDAELTPSQARNLEDVTGFAVCDREAVILNVFERNATTRRARMQVEIAHLEYLRPRIRGIGLNMDQQAGGVLGSRGPGETASDLLARKLDRRLAQLRTGLVDLKRSDGARRKQRSDAKRIALVGYTNAGKTSLMNALTHTALSARSRPFETLDTTSRCLSRHGSDVLLSDTAGFIRRLSERLLASFESTLAEACEASLLVIVVDVADPEHRLHLETTEGILERLGAAAIPRLYAFNKADCLEAPPSDLPALAGGHPYFVLSSHDDGAVLKLRERLLDEVRSDLASRTLFIPYHDARAVSRIYAKCRVLASEARDNGMLYTVEGQPHVLDALSNTAGEGGQR